MRARSDSMDASKKFDDDEIVAMMRNLPQKERGLMALMERYQRPLYAHIRQMVQCHDDADDILQSTFIKVWRFIDGFRAESSLRTWLFQIATNECLTLLDQRRKRNQCDFREIDNSLEHSEQATTTMDGEGIQLKLDAAIAMLPDKQRQVFLLKYYGELKYVEMVEILGGTVGSLKASFHHAVKKIENFLSVD
ncbi:MAG: hypothetical protein RLZZ165_2262 [Bacteroidota bacterium]